MNMSKAPEGTDESFMMLEFPVWCVAGDHATTETPAMLIHDGSDDTWDAICRQCAASIMHAAAATFERRKEDYYPIPS